MAEPRVSGGDYKDITDLGNLFVQMGGLYGSGKTTETSSSSTESNRQQQKLLDQILGMNNSQYLDDMTANIMNRAKQEFAPILGQSMGAGERAYSSTVIKQLADEAMARATAASGQARLEFLSANQKTAAGLITTKMQSEKTTTRKTGKAPAATALNVIGTGLTGYSLFDKFQQRKVKSPNAEPELLNQYETPGVSDPGVTFSGEPSGFVPNAEILSNQPQDIVTELLNLVPEVVTNNFDINANVNPSDFAIPSDNSFTSDPVTISDVPDVPVDTGGGNDFFDDIGDIFDNSGDIFDFADGGEVPFKRDPRAAYLPGTGGRPVRTPPGLSNPLAVIPVLPEKPKVVEAPTGNDSGDSGDAGVSGSSGVSDTGITGGSSITGQQAANLGSALMSGNPIAIAIAIGNIAVSQPQLSEPTAISFAELSQVQTFAAPAVEDVVGVEIGPDVEVGTAPGPGTVEGTAIGADIGAEAAAAAAAAEAEGTAAAAAAAAEEGAAEEGGTEGGDEGGDDGGDDGEAEGGIQRARSSKELGIDNKIIKVTPGEYVLPVDVVEFLGKDVLDLIVDTVHTPVKRGRKI